MTKFGAYSYHEFADLWFGLFQHRPNANGYLVPIYVNELNEETQQH